MSHDGQTAYGRIKHERFDNKMLPSTEKVVLMMPMDNQKRNKLESVLASIVPRTREFGVLTSSFAVAVNTITDCLQVGSVTQNAGAESKKHQETPKTVPVKRPVEAT